MKKNNIKEMHLNKMNIWNNYKFNYKRIKLKKQNILTLRIILNIILIFIR